MTYSAPSPPRRVDEFALYLEGVYEFMPKDTLEWTTTPPSSSSALSHTASITPAQTLATPLLLKLQKDDSRREACLPTTKPKRRRNCGGTSEQDRIVKLAQMTRTHKMRIRQSCSHEMKTNPQGLPYSSSLT